MSWLSLLSILNLFFAGLLAGGEVALQEAHDDQSAATHFPPVRDATYWPF